MLVRDIMRSPALAVSPDTTLQDAYPTMRESSIRHLPVLDGAKLVGVITDRDLRLATSALAPSPFTPGSRVAEVMSERPVTADASSGPCPTMASVRVALGHGAGVLRLAACVTRPVFRGGEDGSVADGKSPAPPLRRFSFTMSLTVTSFEGVLDGRTLGRLDRWRKTRALFLRADSPEAERALAEALESRWTRAQIYGRSRRVLVERAMPLLTELEPRLGVQAARVRVSPEDPGQTKWDAIGNLMPLAVACRQIRCLWLVDVLQEGGLAVEFQSIFDLRSGEALGYEGLLRGYSPDGTRHLAEALFPAAHVLGIEHAFEQISWLTVFKAAKRLPEDSLLFLNVNPLLLVAGDGSLAGLGREAERMEFPYARLALDIVEVERVESLERLSSALDVPHDLGVSIALDDVKSSFGLLKYCAGLRPRWVKVDSEITRGVAADSQRRAILRMLSEVTRGANAGLIAEGIESGDDLDVCLAEGVFAAQGYFLARPSETPTDASPEFRAWLDSRGGRILPFGKPGASEEPEAPKAEPDVEP